MVVCGWDSELMLEEMFAPILCVVPYDDLRDAAAEVRARPKPLALYVFSNSVAEQRIVLDNTTSGGSPSMACCITLGTRPCPSEGWASQAWVHTTASTPSSASSIENRCFGKWRRMGDFGALTDPWFVYGPHDGVKLKLLRAVAEMS